MYSRLFFLAALFVAVHGDLQQTIYLAPEGAQDASCPTGPECLSLEDYWDSQGALGGAFPSHTTVVFLSGTHRMGGGRRVVVRDVENVTLLGETGARVECERERAGFVFMNVTGLRLEGLRFSQCGLNLEQQLVQEAQTVQTRSFEILTAHERAALFVVNVQELSLDSVTVENSSGYGILGINILGESSIRHSHFLYNNHYTYGREQCQNATKDIDLLTCYGVDLYLSYTDTSEKCPEVPITHTLSISSSSVSHSTNLVSIGIGSGLLVVMGQSEYGVIINIDNFTSSHNQGSQGPNMAFLIYEVVDNSSISINNSFSHYSNPYTFTHPGLASQSYVGGALWYAYGRPIPTNYSAACPGMKRHHSELLRVSNTEIVGNIGGGVRISFDTVVETGIQFQISLENVTFRDNTDDSAAALYLRQLEPIHQILLVTFLINQCTFINNTLLEALVLSENAFQSPIQLFTLQHSTIIDSTFEANSPTALLAYKSNVHFHGNSTFINNHGRLGGGVALYGASLLLLTPSTYIQFINNTASMLGGGLYVSGKDSQNSRQTLCFYQIDQSDFTLDLDIPIKIELPGNSTQEIVDVAEGLGIQASFRDNTAGEAGGSLYGGRVDQCTLVSTQHLRNYYNQPGRIFNQIFVFMDNISTSTVSAISSNPQMVCLCYDNKPNCSVTHTNKTIFPGQSFEMSVLTFGQRGGISPGVVYASFITNSARSGQKAPTLTPSQRTQQVGGTCTTLQYSILSHTPTTMMTLATGRSTSQLMYVNVSLLECPLGFKLSDKTPLKCVCDPLLADSHITCSIETQTVQRVAPAWISHSGSNVLLHPYCPFDYCNGQVLELNVSEPDSQCSDGRTGKLCGACRDGYSLTLGSSQCQECSSAYLSLLTIFLVAGVVLVLLPYICNYMTVSVGAINGLVFYANLVQINQGIYLPPGERNLLTVFISWINLDLGIKTCFYNGMDTYVKTWLQFVFPVYIWLIAGFIIVLSHYSTRVAALTGNNGVPVLATLILLSFAKLQRTIITAFSFTAVSHSDGSYGTVWLYDGTLPYLQGKHVYLFTFALLTLLLSFPYTFLLLLSPWLQAHSSHRLLHWVNKLKPFLDAYQGPYKDRHRHWTGALLFTRGVLFLIYSFNVLYGPFRNLLVTAVTMLVLLGYGWITSHGGVYKKWTLNILEFSFLLNLGVLSTAMLYIGVAGGNKAAVSYTSISIALAEFLGIVVVNMYNRFSASRWRGWWALLHRGKSIELPVESEEKKRPTSSTVNFDPFDQREKSGSFSCELREPLIESDQHSSI